MEDVGTSLLSLNEPLSSSTRDNFRHLQHIRERITELENDIGGLPKDKRELTKATRPILSLIRGLHLALQNLKKRERMTDFETFVKTFDKIKHFFDGCDSASSKCTYFHLKILILTKLVFFSNPLSIYHKAFWVIFARKELLLSSRCLWSAKQLL